MTSWIWDRFVAVATEKAHAVAVTQGTAQASYTDLLRAAEKVSAELSLARGDRVVLTASNSTSFVLLVAAIWRRGAIPILVNSEAPPVHVSHAIEKTSASLVFADDAGKICDHDVHALPPLEDLDTQVEGLPPHACGGDDIASVIFTSGSTGPPKGVMQRSETLIDGARRVGQMLGYNKDDKILCAVPFSFDYGWGQLLSMMTQGVSLVLPEKRNAFALCDALSLHAPTILAGVPAVYADLLSGLSPIREVARDSVRLITNTGSRLPDGVFQQLVDVFPNADLSLNYGLTETYRSASLPVHMAQSHRESVGYALEGVTLMIQRDDGSRAAPMEEGEIIHAGAGVFEGYWGEPEKTAKTRATVTLEDGLNVSAVRTGDYGHLDEDGRLYIHGRRDRQTKCMGVRVALDEVEALLEKSNLVAEVAVTSTPNDTLGSLITAHIVDSGRCASEKETMRALKKYARETLSVYMQPRAFQMHAALPRNVNGKVDYLALCCP